MKNPDYFFTKQQSLVKNRKVIRMFEIHNPLAKFEEYVKKKYYYWIHILSKISITERRWLYLNNFRNTIKNMVVAKKPYQNFTVSAYFIITHPVTRNTLVRITKFNFQIVVKWWLRTGSYKVAFSLHAFILSDFK